MIIQSIQFRNLGALGTTTSPILLHQLLAEKPLDDDHPANNLGVTVLHGANYIGKTTLKLGIYFALGGSGMVDDRKVPTDIVRDGQIDLMVALTVRHFGEASGLTWGGFNHPILYTEDLLTLVRHYEKGKSSNTYYVIDGQHDLAESFPPGANTKREDYLALISRMGVNEGVLRVYRQAMRQGQISTLTELKDQDLFHRVAEVAGYEKKEYDYSLAKEELFKQHQQLQTIELDLSRMKPELQRIEERRERYLRLVEVEKKLGQAQITYNTHKATFFVASMQLGAREQHRAEQEHTTLEKRLAEHETATTAKREQWQRLDETIKESKSALEKIEHHLRNILYKQEAEFKQSQITYQKTLEETPRETLEKSAAEWQTQADKLKPAYEQIVSQKVLADDEVKHIQSEIENLESQQTGRRLPPYVQKFSRALQAAGIEHNFLADVLNIWDDSWQRPVEEFLGSRRFWAMIAPSNFNQAQKIVEDLEYRPGICTPKPLSPETKIADNSGTVWEILDLGDAQEWAGHIDDLGRQVRADSADQVEAVKQSGRKVFTKKGLVSDSGRRAYSIRRWDKDFTLCCGAKALELQLAVWRDRLPSAITELEQLKAELAKIEAEQTRYQEFARQRLAYDEAHKTLPTIEQNLTAIEVEIEQQKKKLESLRDESSALSQQWYEVKNDIEQAELQFKRLEDNLEETGRAIERAGNRRKTNEDELNKMSSGDISQIEAQLSQEITQGEGDPITLLRKIAEDRETAYKAAQADIDNYQSERKGIVGSDDLTERVLHEYDRLQQSLSQKQNDLEAAQKNYEIRLGVAEASYNFLKQQMEIATQVVQNQANQVGKPLGIQFRLSVKMPHPREYIDLEDRRKFVPAVELRVKFDDERSFRRMQDPYLSGGQKEMASTCLLGGFLFASQSLTHREGVLFERPVWQISPPLLLDEPLKSLSHINARRTMGGLLEIPCQIIIADPRPAKEIRDASEIVVSLKKGLMVNDGTEAQVVNISVQRGSSVTSRTKLALEYRGEQYEQHLSPQQNPIGN